MPDREKEEPSRIPQHVAIILDGNGRWAAKRRMPRNYGHAQGSKNVEAICRAAYDMGVRYLTFYAFSTENWSRPQEEIDELMRILDNFLKDAVKKCKKNNMRLRVIGDVSILTDSLRTRIAEAEKASAEFTGLQLQIALNYGGRDELVRAVRSIVREAAEHQNETPVIDEACLAAHLDTAGIPDPELLIRTSGEQRLSNFLLWQLAYAEFYFTEVLWPDFTKEDLKDALLYFSKRQRRFGGL